LASGWLRKDGDSQGRISYIDRCGIDRRDRGWTLTQRPDEPEVWEGQPRTDQRLVGSEAIQTFREKMAKRSREETDFIAN
jgi:hypothetical protein